MPKPKLSWKRGVVQSLATGPRKVWTSRCGQYRIELYYKRLGGLPDLYYAMRRMDDLAWHTISTHQKRETAEAACQKDANARSK